MFEQIEAAPPDAILGISEAFGRDPNPNKINLSVGVYKDESGVTPILDAVRRAENRVLAEQKTKGYLGIPGSPDYARAVQRLLFGPAHEIIESGRAATAHTPGGTGALRVAADFLKQNLPGRSVWLSQPTWPNHPNIFQAAGIEVREYPYLDAATGGLDFDGMMATLQQIPRGDVVLLHGCCHNPTGVDPTGEQWNTIADLVSQRGLIPLLDFAYQGFAEEIDADAVGLRTLCRPGAELLVCNSFSKNFGLYRDRVGALTLIASDQDTAERAMSQLKRSIRSNYSNPPAHGGNIVTTILGDAELTALWRTEVAQMRSRIHDMRRLFVETLQSKGVERDFSFITAQSGMFSFSGLTPEQVDILRDQYSIYIVRNGRINVAGMTRDNMDTLCSAIAEIVS